MKEFILETKTKRVTFNFPTSLDEITPEYLSQVTANVKVADNYSLVGIVYQEVLSSVILARKQSKKNITSGVVPIFIKAGNTDIDFIKSAKCKNKIIISSTQLSLGYHVTAAKNVLGLDYFIRVLDQDTTIAKRYNNNYGMEKCCFVEFKLVPNCDIVGIYDSTKVDVDNKYISVEDIEEGE